MRAGGVSLLVVWQVRSPRGDACWECGFTLRCVRCGAGHWGVAEGGLHCTQGAVRSRIKGCAGRWTEEA